MWHPYRSFSDLALRRLLIGFGSLTILCMLALERINKGLHIVDLELAGSLSAAEQIMTQWPERGEFLALFGTGLDYLFLLTYSVTLGIACLQVAKWIDAAAWQKLGYLLAGLLLFAGLLDAIENYALFHIILGNGSENLTKSARYCAIPKFSIVILSVGYLVIGLVYYFTKRIFRHAT